MTLLGWVLVVIGIGFLLLGFIAAAKEVLKRETKNAVQKQVASYASAGAGATTSTEVAASDAAAAAESEIAQKSILELATAFINALIKLPMWLALTLVGILLILFGSRLAEIIVDVLGS